jgi:hypothetical protein
MGPHVSKSYASRKSLPPFPEKPPRHALLSLGHVSNPRPISPAGKRMPGKARTPAPLMEQQGLIDLEWAQVLRGPVGKGGVQGERRTGV